MSTGRVADVKLFAALEALAKATDEAAARAATVEWAREVTAYLVALRRAVMEPSK